VTDGERLVWATTYALVFDRNGDSIAAARAAARAVEQLREAAQQKPPSGGQHVLQIDERDYLDEIVSIP
jgi:hypothetical protein